MKTAAQLKREIEESRRSLAQQTAQLEALQRACQHQFGPVEYVPLVTEGYRTQGDPEGTMGVDRQLPTWIPGSTTKKWQRTCPLCELTQTTTRTKKQARNGSLPGTTAEEELPVFDEPRRF